MEKTSCSNEFNRVETEIVATATPFQGTISDSDNSQMSVTRCMAHTKEKVNSEG